MAPYPPRFFRIRSPLATSIRCTRLRSKTHSFARLVMTDRFDTNLIATLTTLATENGTLKAELAAANHTLSSKDTELAMKEQRIEDLCRDIGNECDVSEDLRNELDAMRNEMNQKEYGWLDERDVMCDRINDLEKEVQRLKGKLESTGLLIAGALGARFEVTRNEDAEHFVAGEAQLGEVD